MSVYELHRYAEFWEKPSEFIPSRFNDTHKKDNSDYYYPFGAGPRMCVGNNFAMFEMILAVAEIVRTYKIKTSLEKVEINPLISLKPKSVPLLFEER